MVKHSNITLFATVLVCAMVWYYLKIEYHVTASKPVLVIGALILLKLWLRRVNTATYILFHVLVFGGVFLWLRHFLDSMTSFDTLTFFTQILREAVPK